MFQERVGRTSTSGKSLRYILLRKSEIDAIYFLLVGLRPAWQAVRRQEERGEFLIWIRRNSLKSPDSDE